MAVIAAKCPQYKITVADINEEKIKAWQTENLPIYEPGLLETVKKSRDRNLFFSTDIEENIKKADIIFVSVNTPTKMYGIGAGKTADLQFWEKSQETLYVLQTQTKLLLRKVHCRFGLLKLWNGFLMA